VEAEDIMSIVTKYQKPGVWKKVTPQEMFKLFCNWIRNGCPRIGKLLIVEDDRARRRT
jgi:hypothetical protein